MYFVSKFIEEYVYRNVYLPTTFILNIGKVFVFIINIIVNIQFRYYLLLKLTNQEQR